MHLELTLTDDEDTIYIFHESMDKEDPFYCIPKVRALELRQGVDFACSDWIVHVGSKTWCYPSLLFKIASIIDKDNPSNTIDWFKSFEYLIKHSYLEEIKNMSITLYSDLEKHELV